MTEGAYRALRSGIEGLVRDGGSGRSVLEFLPSVLARQVAEELRHRYECEIKKDEDHARSLGALGDLHDIHMHIEEVNPKVRKAIYRNDPRNWDYASDKGQRSEEHTSELQSLMRISYAVFCLKKKKKTKQNT